MARAALAASTQAEPVALQQQAALQVVEIERLEKDAARFKWLSDRFIGADFEWGEHQTPVLLIGIGNAKVVWGDLGITIDAALSTQQEQK